MGECRLCHVPAIFAKETAAFLLNDIKPSKEIYRVYHSIQVSQISQTDFTPGFRINYTEEAVATQATAHKLAWAEIVKGVDESPYSIIFDTQTSVDDISLSIYLENAVLPKDWDIFLITETQYILTKRAAKILLNSALQFNAKLSDYIRSFKVLKVINASYQK